MPKKGYVFKSDPWGEFTLGITYLLRYKCELESYRLICEYVKEFKYPMKIVLKYEKKLENLNEKINYIERILNSMPSKHREILLMCYGERKSNAEVGIKFNTDKLGITNYIVKLKRIYQYQIDVDKLRGEVDNYDN